MPIDPNIPLQAKGVQLESPINQLGMMNEAMKFNEMNRSIDTQNKLRDLYAQGVDVSTPEGFRQLSSIDPASAIKLRNQGLETKKLEGDISRIGVEVNQKTYDLVRQKMSDLAFNPSDNNIRAHLEDGILRKEVTPQQAEMTWQAVSALPLDQRKAYFTDLGMKAADRSQRDTTIRGQDVSATTARRGQDIQAGTTRRGQDMQYAPNVVANTVTDATGNVTQFNRFGEVIGKPGQVGKPSATFEKTAALQKQMGKDLTLAITEIENAIKKGGTLDKSTASGAGRLLDAAGNFIGYATEGSIASASLKPIADLGLKMVPRFEGPQSDKDTASYKEAAGQLANESLPVATRRAAAETVVRLMKARKGQFVTEGMAAEGIGASTPALPAGFTPDKP
jgi:hypothetical protein